MIAKQEWTQSNAQQNIEQFQNHTKQIINNKRTTALERTAVKTLFIQGNQLILQTVKTMMKSSILRHFIRVYTVCKGKKVLQAKCYNMF